MFAAWNDSVPLAAALVGWANHRAFYLMGGSTPAGYECGASIWLHWQIASRMADAGFVAYNLGGSSPSAAVPGDPAHGLYRFKTGFGSRAVRCRSLTWTLSSSHARLHRVGRWLTTSSSPSLSGKYD
jgi:lipid II:glycine glycyltransferase (peptidoglycan interpeptide bridge formation enzyme)